MGSAPELIADLQQNNSKDLIRNEVDIEIGTTRYLFWTLPDQSVMKRPFLKQYLSYHKCGIIFFIVNQDKIEEKIHEFASLVSSSILDLEKQNICIFLNFQSDSFDQNSQIEKLFIQNFNQDMDTKFVVCSSTDDIRMFLHTLSSDTHEDKIHLSDTDDESENEEDLHTMDLTEQFKGEDENNNEKIPNVKDLRPSEEDEEIVASN